MSIKTSELQQLSPLTGAERLLADSPGAGTGLIPFNEAAQFLGGELVKPGSAVGAALENKAATDFSNLPNPQTALYNLGAGTGRNLLDNWYLAAPINQRNQTEYTERGYAIDRWALAQGELMLQEGHTLLQKNAILYQTLDTPAKYVGKQMSASVLLSDNTLISVSGVMSDTSHVESTINGTTIFMGAIIGFGLTFPVVCIGTDPQNPAMPQAIKLELGPVQTLAHKAGDTWVLNDPPPDPALELAKCQRYQMVYRCPESGYGHIAYVMKSQEGIWYGFRHLPHSLRIKPSVKVTDGEPILNIFNAMHSVSDWGVLSLTGNHVLIYVSSTSDAPIGTWAMLQTTNSPAKLILDANL